jgi:hypothetical protein
MLHRKSAPQATTPPTTGASQAPATTTAASTNTRQSRYGNAALSSKPSAATSLMSDLLARTAAGSPAKNDVASPTTKAPTGKPPASATASATKAPTSRQPGKDVYPSGPTGPEEATPSTDGVLRPSHVSSRQAGALIAAGTITLQSTEKGGSTVASLVSGTPATVVSSKGARLKVRVRQGAGEVEGWVDTAVFSDQPALAKDEENPKLREDLVYSPIEGDHAPKDPKGSDTAQGGLGDCFFVASMAAVANAAPGLITDMIRYDPKKKTHTVRFFEESGRGAAKPIYIEVDGFLPTSRDSRNDPSYAGDPGGKMWPAIVEKAYAKWKGGYHVLGEGGTGEEAMTALTGGKSTVRDPSSMKESEVVPFFSAAKRDQKAIYAGVVSGVKSSQQQVLRGASDGPYTGKVAQTHRWNEIIPGTVRITDDQGKAPAARDKGKEGDDRAALTGRGVKSGSVGFKDSTLDIAYDAGRGPKDGGDLRVEFDYHGVVDLQSFLIGDHAYAFDKVVDGNKLQFYNPWGTYQPKPITAATFLQFFDTLALNTPPASKTTS